MKLGRVSQQGIVFAIFLAMFAGFAFFLHGFATTANMLALLQNVAVLGILGLGRIGRAMARRARGFDMEIHYHGRARLAPKLEQGAIFHPDLLDFLSCCDFLSIHAALNDQTRGMISARELAALPGGAILVNTARGDIIDDDALIASLKSRHLAAAGLDVFRGEPNIDPRLRALDNVFLLPHLGSATIETRNAMAGRALDNLDAFFAGRTPPDRVAG